MSSATRNKSPSYYANGPGVSHPEALQRREHLSRRSLLRTLALGAGVAPVLPNLGRNFLSPAHAATVGIRRMIFFHHPNGLPEVGTETAFKQWFIDPGATLKTSKLGYLLAPLQRHLDDLVVMQNLEPYQFEKPVNATDSHSHAKMQMLTGNSERPEPDIISRTSVASIDWHLSQTVGKMLTPKFPMLMTGIQCPGETCTYMENGQGNEGHNMNPYDLYKKLFADLMQPGDVNAGPDPKLLARLARRRSALDYVAKDIVQFQKRLGGSERERAEIQLASIRTLEQRLGAGVTMPGGSGALKCSKPVLAPQGLEWEFPNSRNVPELALMMNDIVVASLACNLTNVVSMQTYGGGQQQSTCNFAPVNTVNLPGVTFKGQGWHALSHMDIPVEYYRAAKVWLSTVVADLADKLKAIPEGDGTMLDNTIIFINQEHGIGHGHAGLQLATVGGKNMGVKVGQYMKCGDHARDKGIKSTRLLVSLLNAMGVPADKWGPMDTGSGPLPGFGA